MRLCNFIIPPSLQGDDGWAGAAGLDGNPGALVSTFHSLQLWLSNENFFLFRLGFSWTTRRERAYSKFSIMCMAEYHCSILFEKGAPGKDGEPGPRVSFTITSFDYT